MSVCVYILYVLCIPMCVWMCTQAAQCSSYLTTRRINKEGALVFCRPVVRFNVLCRVLFLKSIWAAVQIFLAVECTSGSVPWFDGVSFVRTICTLLSTVRVCVCVCVYLWVLHPSLCDMHTDADTQQIPTPVCDIFSLHVSMCPWLSLLRVTQKEALHSVKSPTLTSLPPSPSLSFFLIPPPHQAIRSWF